MNHNFLFIFADLGQEIFDHPDKEKYVWRKMKPVSYFD